MKALVGTNSARGNYDHGMLLADDSIHDSARAIKQLQCFQTESLENTITGGNKYILFVISLLCCLFVKYYYKLL